MDPAPPMVHLTTVAGSFPAKVLAARLAAGGVPSELKGALGGPYPLPGVVDVLVPAPMLLLAREILLADAVDALFTPERPVGRSATQQAVRVERARARRRRQRRRLTRREGR